MHNLIDGLNTIAGLWMSGMAAACWQGLLLAGLAWLFCRRYPRTAPSIGSWIWWIVCLKLLVALFCVRPVSVPVLPEPSAATLSHPAAPSAARLPALPAVRLPALARSVLSAPRAALRDLVGWRGLADRATVRQTPSDQGSAMDSDASSISLASLLFCLWLVAVAFQIGLALRQIGRVRKLVGAAVPVEDPMILQRLSEISRRAGLRQAPEVLGCPDAPGPMVFGLFRPALLLPWPGFEQLSTEQQQMALAHEVAHLKRGDLWLSVVPAAAQALFFFFPPVRMACREWTTFTEAACDREALDLTGGRPADYGRLLLSLALGGRLPGLASGLGASLTQSTMKGRLKMLQHASEVPGAFTRRRMMVGATLLVVLLGLLIVVPWRLTRRGGSPTGFPHYSVIDLGTLGGEQTIANSMNDRGQVVGQSYDGPIIPYGMRRAFLWDQGKMTNLGTLGGRTSEACGINNARQVVGYADVRDGTSRAFLWQNGRMENLGVLPGGKNSHAKAINDRGDVVGESDVAGWLRWTAEKPRSHIQHPVLWSHGEMKDLGLLPGCRSGCATSINDSGDIVGYCEEAASKPPYFARRAFLWHDGRMRDLETLGGLSSAAYAINNRGDIAGDGSTAFVTDWHPAFVMDWRPLLWRNGVVEDFGAADLSKFPRALALAFDKTGHAIPRLVHRSYRPGDPVFAEVCGLDQQDDVVGTYDGIPFLSAAGKIWDLSDMVLPGRPLDSACAAATNNCGQICVNAARVGGRRSDGRPAPAIIQSMLLTPVR